ncbi:hypothetical protein V473_18945 [Sphingobium cupriresistens LL01]|uniref:PRC-barrel domain-containing protein n=2 Tax=Sphingobium cupriresistens TaxID=1132417 RepID=A0A0J7XN65_9SPHN|nr:hypothetical protein V473_18945 [Sphingobium cupriresistens LL01]
MAIIGPYPVSVQIEQNLSYVYWFSLETVSGLRQQVDRIDKRILDMKMIITLAALAMATPALAQAPAVDRNAAIFSAEGTKIGKVDKVVTADDGALAAVRVIYRGKFITIPAATLSTGEKGVTTSLSNADLKKF